MENIISASSITYYLIVLLILMAGGITFVSGFVAIYINSIKKNEETLAVIESKRNKNFDWEEWRRKREEKALIAKMKLKNGKLGGFGEWAYDYSDKWYYFFLIGIGLIIIGIIMIII